MEVPAAVSPDQQEQNIEAEVYIISQPNEEI